MTAKPFPNSYWVIPDRFLAGSYPASGQGRRGPDPPRLKASLDAGLDTFIDLTRLGEVPLYLPLLEETATHQGVAVDYHRQPITDKGCLCRIRWSACSILSMPPWLADISSTFTAWEASGAPARRSAVGSGVTA